MQGMGRADEYQAELIEVVAGIKIPEEYRVVEEGESRGDAVAFNPNGLQKAPEE